MEENFSVSIVIPAKRFSEMSSRKRLSRTQFLDSMKDLMVRKMDKDDERL